MRDLNDDGDTLDSVAHLYDFVTGSLTNLGLATDLSAVPTPFSLVDGKLLFRVPEVSQGGADLDGDGDTSDAILHAVLGVVR